MKNWKNITIAVLVVALAAVSMKAFLGEDGEMPAAKGKENVSVKLQRGKKAGRQGEKSAKWTKRDVNSESARRKAREKPTFDISDDDEASLNESQRKLIAEIRAALDAENLDQLLTLVQRMQASDVWPDGVPKSVKMAAIQALGWFGSKGVAEIAGFLIDLDPEVIQAAIDKYGEALSDYDLSDFERSAILVEAGKFIRDEDALDAMLLATTDMRHSVAVMTYKELLFSGNDVVRKLLDDSIESYTGEEGIHTAEQLDVWLELNPDDEDDEERYGGCSDDCD